MTQPMQVRLCDRLLSGYSQPKRCNLPAVVIVDAGTPYALPLCAEHAAEYDASRLAPVPDSPIAAPTFYHYLGQWPDDYAAGGWSIDRLAEDLRRRGFEHDPWASPGRLARYLEAEGLPMTPAASEVPA